jgi:hypothetical protein
MQRTKARGFIDWAISKAKRTDDAAGDLIEDLRRDQRVNGKLKDFTSRQKFVSYLQDHGACDGAIDAANKVWARFERARFMASLR